MNILFYGNCQLYAVLKTLNLPSNYKSTLIECWIENIDKDYFTDIIKKSDIIITQSINDKYRDVDYLSTNYIINNKKSGCKLIIFDSCYFHFYYFDLTYKQFNNDILRKPIDYHYNTMIDCYNNGQSIDYYINNFVNNINLKTNSELEELAETSLNELRKRYIENVQKYTGNNIYIISTYDYIKENYKNKLLFYSMNHPTKYVIQHICEKIISILKFQTSINYSIDVLNSTKCILYACISKNVNFNINAQEVLTLNVKDVSKITQLYYDTYKEIGYK
jgi:hypothetical protein